MLLLTVLPDLGLFVLSFLADFAGVEAGRAGTDLGLFALGLAETGAADSALGAVSVLQLTSEVTLEGVVVMVGGIRARSFGTLFEVVLELSPVEVPSRLPSLNRFRLGFINPAIFPSTLVLPDADLPDAVLPAVEETALELASSDVLVSFLLFIFTCCSGFFFFGASPPMSPFDIPFSADLIPSSNTTLSPFWTPFGRSVPSLEPPGPRVDEPATSVEEEEGLSSLSEILPD